MTYQRRQHTSIKKFGTYGRHRVQRYRCTRCSATFGTGAPKVGNHLISLDKATQIISLMVEGMSIRAISRITGAD